MTLVTLITDYFFHTEPFTCTVSEKDIVWARGDDCRVPLPTGVRVWGGDYAPVPENFSIFKLKKASFGAFWVLFCSWIEWKLVRPMSGMHWLASFGDVLISFEIETSLSEDDYSRQTIHYRSVIDSFYVMLVSLFCLFVMLASLHSIQLQNSTLQNAPKLAFWAQKS